MHRNCLKSFFSVVLQFGNKQFIVSEKQLFGFRAGSARHTPEEPYCNCSFAFGFYSSLIKGVDKKIYIFGFLF